MTYLIQNVIRAISWRNNQAELQGLATLRLFAGASDGVKGLWIDRYGSLIVICLYEPGLKKHKQDLLKAFLAEEEGFEVMFKLKTKKGFEADFSSLKNREFECEELDCKYLIKTELEHDFGLFIDTFSARQWLSKFTAQKQVLNLFSYTCVFGVVGKKYEAEQVTNIDPNQDYLAWGKANASMNDLDFRNLCDPAQKYLPRHIRRLGEGKDAAYDIVIADPPAFLVGRRDDRLGRKIWPKLLEWFCEMKAEFYILICNDRSFRQSREMKSYFSEGLKHKYKITQLKHRSDLLGQDFQQLKNFDDYLPPDIFIATRKGKSD